jgi:ABC-2 type transport system permease protein
MSSIHDQGYRRYQGQRTPPGRAWLVLARAGLADRLRQRRFLALLLLAWAPFLVRAVQIYTASSFAQAAFLAPTAETYREFLDQQSLFVFFVAIYVGAGAIASDRRANALALYLSKPLTRLEYIAGRLVPLLVFLLGVTLLPALLLVGLQLVFAGSLAFARENLAVFPAITLFSLVQALVSAMTILALSSLSRSQRFVGVMYAGAVFFTAALYQMLRAMTGSRVWAWISPEDTLDVVADALFRLEGPPGLPAPAAFLSLIVLVAVSCWVLERRVRPVEVVT